MPLLFIFVILPLVEIALLIKVGGLIGLWPTLVIIIGSAVLGSWLLRRQGALAMSRVQRAVGEMRDPSAPMADGALILLAGALLILPGFLTDTLGLALLLAPVRRALMANMGRRLRSRAAMRDTPAHRYGRGAVIDADYVEEITPEAQVSAQPNGQPPGRPHGPSGWTRGPEAQ